MLIDDSRNDDVRVGFYGFTDDDDEVHMWFIANSSEDRWLNLVAVEPKINGKNCRRNWKICKDEYFDELVFEINLTEEEGIQPKGKYEISAWLQCFSEGPGGLCCGSQFLATVDFDKGIQSCRVVGSDCDRLEK